MAGLFGLDFSDILGEISLPDFLKDDKIITAGIVTTGSLLAGLFGQKAQEGISKDALKQKDKELLLLSQEKERDRQLQKELALIGLRAKGAGVKKDVSAYSNMAQRVQQGSALEQGAIGNLINAQQVRTQ